MYRLFLPLIVVLLATGCSTQFSNKNPIGKIFPTVAGQTLTKEQVVLPAHFDQQPVVILLGYVQNAQFDIDRWLIGLDMTKTEASIYELPTIAGMFPRFFKTQIDNGMRAGIPKSLWKGVITIYDDGEKVQQFTGNENPNNARVVILDKAGTIRFFYDQGFSVAALNELRDTLESL